MMARQGLRLGQLQQLRCGVPNGGTGGRLGASGGGVGVGGGVLAFRREAGSAGSAGTAAFRSSNRGRSFGRKGGMAKTQSSSRPSLSTATWGGSSGGGGGGGEAMPGIGQTMLLRKLQIQMQQIPRVKVRNLYTVMTRKRSLQLLGFKIETTLSNLCGHGSFVVLAIAYMESDVLLLRGYAVGSIALSSLFQFYRPQPLWIPISWGAVFFLINTGFIVSLLEERRAASHMERDEAEVFQEVYEPMGLSAHQFRALYRLASTRTVPKGQVLQQAGDRQKCVYLITSGSAQTELEGEAHSTLDKHAYIGSIAFLRYALLEGEDDSPPLVTTTIRTQRETRVLAWDFQELKEFLLANPTIKSAFSTSISADLSSAIDESRSLFNRYRDVLKTSLDYGECTPLEKRKLGHYRETHGVTKGVHEQALHEMGWTDHEFSLGFKETTPIYKYEVLLREEVKDGVVSEEGRKFLRAYRGRNGITAEEHLLALESLGWTMDNWEGGRIPNKGNNGTSSSNNNNSSTSNSKSKSKSSSTDAAAAPSSTTTTTTIGAAAAAPVVVASSSIGAKAAVVATSSKRRSEKEEG